MLETDVERTPSKKRGSSSGLTGLTSDQSHSSLEGDAETPYSTFQSAYTAPPYPRPQADRDHQQESITLDRERGDLTAHNLELIPNADQVAPGIRLDRGGNDYLFHNRSRNNKIASTSKDHDGEEEEEREDPAPGVKGEEGEEEEDEGRGGLSLRDRADRASILSGKTPSSIDATGRSSNGNIDMDDGGESDSHEMFEDVDEELFDDKHVGLLHERVGGSGATSENASKGASVGHFGPRGEAIPGVPPHLDPRQPHFRPPSPSAASVVSVAVHPPASPKMHGLSGGMSSNGGGGSSTLSSYQDILDSGEETERFESGALTPTLSEDIEDDVGLEKERSGHSGFDTSSPTPSPSLANDASDPFNFGRLNLGTGPQVSFDPNVLSYQADSLGGLNRTTRAPSIAATAGSSRAPSTRGTSPPASLSRATTEGSSMGEFDSTGTGIGESGAETPSIVRSRRSSYSAPSSELEPREGVVGVEGGDVGTRARGATLTASANTMPGSSTNLTDEGEDHMRDGPSLAPSEAGSDSARSMTQDSSSLDHSAYAYPSSGGIAVGGHGSSDRIIPSSIAAMAGTSSPGMFEPPSPLEFGTGKGSAQPVLPSLLAIKKASRRTGSGAASTVATAGTTSPASNLSVDGDYEEGVTQQVVE